MNAFGISEISYQLLVTTTKKYPEIENILVYGSRAKGNFKPGSDIDLAIVGKNATDQIALNLSAELNERIQSPYYFDIINYSTLYSPGLKDHIDRIGKPLF